MRAGSHSYICSNLPYILQLNISDFLDCSYSSIIIFTLHLHYITREDIIFVIYKRLIVLVNFQD
jgi:hypothetical protein